MKRLKLAFIGCGNRVRIYSSLAGKMTDQYLITGAADPNKNRLNMVKEFADNPDFKSFSSDKELFEQDKIADVLIIGTQDNYHFEPCKRALQKGYDVLLEKPIAPNMEEILELQSLAETLNRKLQVCYVLRYTPFYQKIKRIIESNILGEIVSINANEGVIPWHQAHSYVRGNWNQVSKASPMIVAKCSHDLDIISWLINKQCLDISSFGSLSHFTLSNAPLDAPERCTDGCPHSSTCQYDASKYANEHRFPWLAQVYDCAEQASEEEICEWLAVSDYGKCVYHSGNDVVDRQIVSMKFADGICANLTMTAFELGRQIEIFGTKGILKGGHFLKRITGKDIIIETFGGEHLSYELDVDHNDHHLGGDEGIIKELYDEMSGLKTVPVSSYIQSHVMAYAAEESRLTQKTINLNDFCASFEKLSGV